MRAHKNALEWAVFGISAVAIAAVLALLLTTGATSADKPPLLQITVGAPVTIGDAHRLPVSVKNSGDETAEDTHIEVALMSGEQVVERAELTIAFVPRGSTRNGWVMFRNDPRRFKTVTRASGFNAP